jgi:hypothetical protein
MPKVSTRHANVAVSEELLEPRYVTAAVEEIDRKGVAELVYVEPNARLTNDSRD